MPIIIGEKEFKELSKKRKPKRVRPVRSSKKAERSFRKRLDKLWKDTINPISEQIKSAIKNGASMEHIADLIQSGIRTAELQYGMAADEILVLWKLSVERDTRVQFEKALLNSLGVDLKAVLDDPVVSQSMNIAYVESANLITSIPRDYLGNVAKAVADNFYGNGQPADRTLLQQIQHIGDVSYKRARLIARDQTNKAVGKLNQVRQQSIGVEEYIWRTVKDERVVGRPGGVYPPTPEMGRSTKHGNHWEREGRRFSWNDPPPDGHPRQAIQCRCHAEPVIDIKKLAEKARVE